MLRRSLTLVCALCLSGVALAQQEEAEVTTVTTMEYGGEDLLSQLWYMEDATPLDPGQVDFRLGFRWVTESKEANLGDSDDDFVLTPAIVWGVVENLELSLAVDNWLGDGGDMGPFRDGNYDTTLGVLWRIHTQGGECAEAGCLRMPSVALSGSLRIPTGCRSSGMDGELRLVMTNDYDNGIRSHLNIFGKAVDGDNEGTVSDDWGVGEIDWIWGTVDNLDSRDFQCGVVIGADGPLCADGAVRWVADYLHKTSKFKGRGDMNVLELGWEWTMSEMHKLGMSMQIGLDHNDDNPNFGAGLMYALSIGA